MPQSPAEVRAFFDAHRTVRRYRTAPDGGALPLPTEHLDTLLHAAQRAPTDATAQLYSIVHLQDTALRQDLATLTKNAHLATASAAFVLCADVHRVARILEASGHAPGSYPHVAVHFGIGDAALAGANLLTAAEMLGYQGCWIGGVLSALEAVVERLALPPGVLPYAGLTVGFPDEAPPQRPRLPREQVVHTDRYREAGEAELRAGIAVMNPIAARAGKSGDWPRLLNAYFGAGGSMEARDRELAEVLRAQELRREVSG